MIAIPGSPNRHYRLPVSGAFLPPVAVAVIACIGCGTGTPVPREGALHGTVTVKGKPMAGAIVFAAPSAAPRESPATAVVGRDGRYVMDAVPLGLVRISVAPVGGPGFPSGLGGPATCDPKFSDPRTSGLSVMVQPGDQQHDIQLD